MNETDDQIIHIEDQLAYSGLFSNKSVDFRFSGNNFSFMLSQSLFSSFDIDSGSRLLLKTIARTIDCSGVSNILDIGCGIGILGICLSGINDRTETYLADRDALALLFSKANAGINRSRNIQTAGSLGISNIPNKVFDLIVSNIPAKAGESVIRQMMLHPLTLLSPQGIFTIVIIKPLEQLAEKILAENNCAVIYRELSRDHSVFHYNGRLNISFNDPFTAYFRNRSLFDVGEIKYHLQTVYGIEEFDTLHYKSILAAELLSKTDMSGKALFYNPGQGHLPVIYAARNRKNRIVYHSGSRDLLSLKITEYNLLHQNISRENIVLHHTASIFELSDIYKTIVYFPDQEESPVIREQTLNKISELLAENGQAIIAGQSTCIQRILAGKSRMIMMKSIKNRGYRAVLFVKKK